VTRRDGSVLQRLEGRSPTLTLVQPGTYTASLTVTDAQGARATATVPLAAGNEPPRVGLDLGGGNRTFFFPGKPVRYAVHVADREDGTLPGRIPESRVTVSADFMKEAPAPGTGHRAAPAEPHAEGRRLVEAGTCLSCHQVDRKSIGPSYTAVARRYRGDTSATARLARKIRRGGSGVWGKVTMPPHPQLSDADATAMAAYVLGLGTRTGSARSLPMRGAYLPTDSAARAGQGFVVLRAAYTDRGATGIPGTTAETTVVLRGPTMVLASGELSEGTQKLAVPQLPVEITMPNRSGAYSKLARIDLTGVTGVTFMAMAPANYGAAGGTIEVHVDSATGPLVGTTERITPAPEGPPQPHRAALRPTSGVHDVYVVFRNEALKGPQMLVVALTATFESAR
jgi:cytochrome c